MSAPPQRHGTALLATALLATALPATAHEGEHRVRS